LVSEVSKVAPSPQVFIQNARWHSTHTELLRNPASHHEIVYRCGARSSVVCGVTNRNRPIPFRENSGPRIA